VWYEGKQTGELYNKSWEIARRIIPSLQRLKSYRDFLYHNSEISKSVYEIEKLWAHYYGGTRIKSEGPYREMGKNLMVLYHTIIETLKKHQYASGK
jgi:hypothetical protein